MKDRLLKLFQLSDWDVGFATDNDGVTLTHWTNVWLRHEGERTSQVTIIINAHNKTPYLVEYTIECDNINITRNPISITREEYVTALEINATIREKRRVKEQEEEQISLLRVMDKTIVDLSEESY